MNWPSVTVIEAGNNNDFNSLFWKTPKQFHELFALYEAVHLQI